MQAHHVHVHNIAILQRGVERYNDIVVITGIGIDIDIDHTMSCMQIIAHGSSSSRVVLGSGVSTKDFT